MQSVQHMITSSRRMLSIVTAAGRTHPSQWTLRARLALTAAVQCQWSWYGRMRPPANRVCRVTPPGRPVVDARLARHAIASGRRGVVSCWQRRHQSATRTALLLPSRRITNSVALTTTLACIFSRTHLCSFTNLSSYYA